MEIESHWTARKRERAGIFPTVRVRPPAENPRPGGSLEGAARCSAGALAGCPAGVSPAALTPLPNTCHPERSRGPVPQVRAGFGANLGSLPAVSARTSAGPHSLASEQLPAHALRERVESEIESEWTARERERKTFGGRARIFLGPGSRPKSGREPGAPIGG